MKRGEVWNRYPCLMYATVDESELAVPQLQREREHYRGCERGM